MRLREATQQEPVAWTGCGECDCSFPCHNGEARCLRLPPLTEPVQEPVAWLAGGDVYKHYDAIPSRCLPPAQQPQPLYAQPAQRLKVTKKLPRKLPEDNDE